MGNCHSHRSDGNNYNYIIIILMITILAGGIVLYIQYEDIQMHISENRRLQKQLETTRESYKIQLNECHQTHQKHQTNYRQIEFVQNVTKKDLKKQEAQLEKCEEQKKECQEGMNTHLQETINLKIEKAYMEGNISTCQRDNSSCQRSLAKSETKLDKYMERYNNCLDAQKQQDDNDKEEQGCSQHQVELDKCKTRLEQVTDASSECQQKLDNCWL